MTTKKATSKVSPVNALASAPAVKASAPVSAPAVKTPVSSKAPSSPLGNAIMITNLLTEKKDGREKVLGMLDYGQLENAMTATIELMKGKKGKALTALQTLEDLIVLHMDKLDAEKELLAVASVKLAPVKGKGKAPVVPVEAPVVPAVIPAKVVKKGKKTLPKIEKPAFEHLVKYSIVFEENEDYEAETFTAQYIEGIEVQVCRDEKRRIMEIRTENFTNLIHKFKSGKELIERPFTATKL